MYKNISELFLMVLQSIPCIKTKFWKRVRLGVPKLEYQLEMGKLWNTVSITIT